MRWCDIPDEDSVQLVYFEVTEYDEPDVYSLAASLETASSADTDSLAHPLSIDEQTLDDDPCVLWPPLHASLSDRSSSCDRSSTCDSESSEHGGTSLKDSAAALLAKRPATAEAARPSRPHEAQRRALGEQLSMGQVLSRRALAATVLTQGCRRSGLPPLPMLPAAVAHEILKVALPLAPPLAHFTNVTGVNVHSALHLSELNLVRTGLGPETAGVVGWLMRQNGALRSLDVSGNELGVAGACAITSSLPAARQLRSLAMNEVAMCSAGGTDPAALFSIAQALHDLPHLESLELRRNALGASGHSGLRALCAALARPNCPLRRLDLAHNSLQSAGAALVAVALLETPRLEELHLSSNLLTGPYGKAREGVRALAVAIALNTTLRLIDLSSNAIGARRSESMDQWHKTPCCATVHLVRALEQNSTLKQMRLSGNHLVGRQGEELLQAWKRHAREAPLAL
ncbi:hypothetical protein AB1Y20_006481 [Prymnesium parvum]|uniref:Uncharacterized protein n=1 Tax=Prymnesium parvum TaxID=97485 RepID=A0AB34IZX3_PRYPA